MIKTKMFLLIILFLFIAVPDNAFALFNYSFDLPIEGGTIPGKMVNSNFQNFVSSSVYQALLKAGFMLMLLWGILKIGFGNLQGLKDFIVYLVVFFLLIAPLPVINKPIPIYLMDKMDELTNSIIVKLGHYPTYAGSGISFVNAHQFATNYAAQQNVGLAHGLNDCYVKAQNKYPDRIIDKNNPSVYEGITTDKVPLNFWGRMGNFVRREENLDTYSCVSLYKNAVDSLKLAYIKGIDQYMRQAQKIGVQLNPEAIKNLESLKSSMKGENLIAYSMSYAKSHPEAAAEKTRDTGFFAFLDAIKSLFTEEGARSFFFIAERLIIGLVGSLSLWFFDYYVYHIGSLLKTMAGIGMAIGVLFYAITGRLNMIFAATGAWMFANGTYIVASIIMTNYWDRVNKDFSDMLYNVTTFILGTPGAPLVDAFTMLSFALMFYTALAGIITWSGVGLSLKLPSPALAPILVSRTVSSVGGVSKK